MLFSLRGILQANHFDQFGSRVFNFGVAVLSSSAFHSKQSAPMNCIEVAIRKLVAGFNVLGVSLIDSEIPLPVFTEIMLAEEFIFLFRRGLMSGPRAFFIGNEMTLVNQFSSVVESSGVQL